MSSKEIKIYTVDSFSPVPFGGNPAAVCLLDEDVTDDFKQKIAEEMKLSETAFVVPVDKNLGFDKGTKFGLRWFTPTTEVPLCGHATLASAAVLFYTQGNENIVEFETKSGILTCNKTSALKNGVEMKLPINDPHINLDDNIDESINELIKAVLQGVYQPMHVRLSPTTKKLLIRLPNGTTRADLEAMKIDIEAMLKINTSDKVRGVIITIDGQGTQYDFISRYFAPWVGIPEDPVTGSAHTVLVPYWSQQLKKNDFFARQSSPRGGELGLKLNNDHILIQGQGTIVLSGLLHL